jgi:hypothetical protein
MGDFWDSIGNVNEENTKKKKTKHQGVEKVKHENKRLRKLRR